MLSARTWGVCARRASRDPAALERERDPGGPRAGHVRPASGTPASVAATRGLCSFALPTTRCIFGVLVVAVTACGAPRGVPATAPTHVPTASTSAAAPALRVEVPLGEAAMARLEAIMDLPRALGDPRRGASIDALEAMLLEVGAPRVRRFETTGHDPREGEAFALTSLVAHLRPEAKRRFVLATHFDTRPWADESSDPADHARAVPGANDGTSGVALVLELAARLPTRLPEDVGISVILFDGEELGRPGGGGYCVGSRDLAERLSAGEDPLLATAELGIVLDMVGDRDLHIPVEPGSQGIHPALVRHVWGTAASLGHDAFDPTPREIGVYDDHRPLSDAGIPSILLIDRDYPVWHTLEDTIDQVSAQSLGAVGETVLEAMVRWYA